MRTISKLLLVMFLVVGCATPYRNIVTLTEVADAAMREWATLSVQGKTWPELDEKVVQLHDEYREACRRAHEVLLATGGAMDAPEYVRALTLAKVSLTQLIDYLARVLTPETAAQLKHQAQTASRP